MPLAFADIGTEYIIQRIGGRQETRKHLENMGFVLGTSVTVLNKVNGNLIVKVKECRVALSEELAQKIVI